MADTNKETLSVFNNTADEKSDSQLAVLFCKELIEKVNTNKNTQDAKNLELDNVNSQQDTNLDAEIENRKNEDSKLDLKIDNILNSLNMNDGYVKTTDFETAINQKANAVNVYTKAEIDQKLIDISAGDNSIDLSNYYIKNEVDTLLTPKANLADVITTDRYEIEKKTFAMKEEVDTSIDGLNSKITNLTNTIIDKDTIASTYATKEELTNQVQILTEKNTLLENKLTEINTKLENFMNNFAINPNSANESILWTKSEYDALEKKDNTKVYLIKNS